jgi:hypothetical protein
MTRDDQLAPAGYKFSGFLTPNYTQIPDQVFDELLPILSGNEIKILMYICRRTFGFKKGTDNISLAQMVSGITAKDGTKLDGGTGLSKASVARALKDLEDKDIILRVRRSDPQRGDLPTTYQLNVIDPRKLLSRGEEGSNNSDTPRVSVGDTPLSRWETPRVSLGDTQETVIQETEKTTTKANSVVVALSEWGISQNVSQALAKAYPPEQISEKIEFLKYLIEHEPKAIKKPAAWLRKAIEENYGAPDGYKTAVSKANVERQTNAENKRKQAVLEAQKAQSERAERQQKEREAAFSERLHRLFTLYQTSDADLAFWEQAKPELTQQGVSEAIITSTQLLKLERDRAVLYVINPFMAQQVAHPRVKEPLTAVLSKLAGHLLQIEIVVENGEQKEKGSG